MSTKLEYRMTIEGIQPRKYSPGGLHDWAVLPGLSEPHPAPAASQLLCLSVPVIHWSSFPRGLPLLLCSSVCCCGQGQTWVLFLGLT